MKDAVPKVESYLVERFQATLERSARAGPVEHGDSKNSPAGSNAPEEASGAAQPH